MPGDQVVDIIQQRKGTFRERIGERLALVQFDGEPQPEEVSLGDLDHQPGWL